MDFEKQLIVLEIFEDLFEGRMKYNQRNQFAKKIIKWEKMDEPSPDFILLNRLVYYYKKDKELRMIKRSIRKSKNDNKYFYYDNEKEVYLSLDPPLVASFTDPAEQ